MDYDNNSEIEKLKIKLSISKSELNNCVDDIRYAKNQQWSYLYFTILAMSAIVFIGNMPDININYLDLYILLIGFLGILTISIHYYSMKRYRDHSKSIKSIIKQIYLSSSIEDEVEERNNNGNNNSNRWDKTKQYLYDCTRGCLFYFIYMVIILMATQLSLYTLESNICSTSIMLGWLLLLIIFYYALRPIILYTDHN